MTQRILTLLVGITATLAGATHTQANLIVNGSFEDPPVTTGSYTDFTTGSTSITGWTVVGTDVDIISGTFGQNGITFNAQDGTQSLDLSGFSSNSTANGVSQDVATSIGQSYALTFHVGSDTDTGYNPSYFSAATADLSINGGARTSYTNSTAPTDHVDWKLFTVNFTATSTSTNITFYDGSPSSNYSVGLDNVSLTAVPEPSTITLLSTGSAIAGLVTARRHRRASKTPR